MRPFDTATLLEVLPDGSFRGHTSPAHANMVGPFGGVTAACLLQAPMQHTARLAEPVALTVNFAAALVDGEFVITARPLRTNRLTQHWSMELTQGGEIAASATSVFAVRRETWSTPEAAPPANLPTPDTLTRAPLIGRPTWTRHYDMRFARGPRPAVRCPMCDVRGFRRAAAARFGQPALGARRAAAPARLSCTCSVVRQFLPSHIFVRRRKVAPIGTVSLTTHFHADAALLQAQAARHVLGVARALNFRNGYFDQSVEVWSDDWQLLASSHRVVYYRE